MPKIKTLTVERFRGIQDTTLNFDGRCVVLMGENGTGKTSFVDALQFFFQGRVGHLEGIAGISTKEHAPHIHARPSEMRVSLTFDGELGTVVRTLRELSPVPPAFAGYMQAGATTTFILRRKNLLDFILAQPSNRYEQLAAVIGVGQFDRVERAMMKVHDEAKGKLESLQDQRQAHERALRELLGVAEVHDAPMLAALNRKLAQWQQPGLSSWDGLEARKLASVTRSVSPQQTQRAAQVLGAANLLEALRDHAWMEGYRRLRLALVNLQQDQTQLRERLYQEVVASGLRVLMKLQPDHCPLCDQPIDRQELLAALERRVRSAEEVARRYSDVASQAAAVGDQIQDCRVKASALATQLKEMGLEPSAQPLDSYSALLATLSQRLRADPVDMDLLAFEELARTSPFRAIVRCLSELAALLAAERERVEPTPQDKQVVEVVDLLTRVADCRSALQRLGQQTRSKQATLREIEAIYDCFLDTKRSVVQDIYSELEADIRRYFHGLNTDEGYGDVRLRVSEGKRASTEIRMDFHDREEEDPRAFNSEGHLDSLGLCVFLAFVKRFNGEFPLMVLDDLVSSIDSGHRRRICELLLNEFPEHQLLITTHDYVWFEELCAHQRAFNKQHLFINHQIVDWSLDDGPRLEKHRPVWERVQDKLGQADKDGAASDTRKALEALLFDLCASMTAPVALRPDGKYTVGDLHAPFVARFKKLVPNVYEEHVDVFQTIEANGIFGNLLVHNNPRAGNAALGEVRGFVDAVRGLEALVTCPQCGRRVEYHRAAKIIKCPCGAAMWPTKE